ncbi:zinc finger protein 62 homolog isoform X1 [Mya arenaria]|uniref:zinc finger protein 62 homolog isoform X1 n=1 Tax=Mya arenaria TaxID=6604 RepID=UPI0022E15E50|nr:zinc finger protein 62 homolog isoform X1 [Mya arenaria]
MAAEERDIEETEEFTLAVKYVLKRQMKDLITQMREQGEEMVVMAVNIQDGTSTHFGTPLGDCFITEQKSLTNNFVTFCKSNGQKKSKAVGTQYSSKKIAATPKGRAKAATSASTDAPTLKITVPKKMSVGISEQELGGLVGRIVASQLTQNKAKGDGSSGGTKFDALLESIKKGKAPDTPSGVTRSGRKVSNKYLEGIKSARKRVKLEKEDSGDEEIPESFILNQLTDLEAGAMKKVQVKTGDGKNIDVQKTTLAQAEQMEILATSIIKQLENIPNVAQRKQVKVSVELTMADLADVQISYPGEKPLDQTMDDSDMEYEDYEDEEGYSEMSMKTDLDEDASEGDGGVETPGAGKRTRKGRKKGVAVQVEKVICTICDKDLVGKWSLETHMGLMHNNTPCNVCKAICSGKVGLRKHLNRIHTIECHGCKAMVVESVPWKEGMEKTTTRIVKCQECDELVSIVNDEAEEFSDAEDEYIEMSDGDESTMTDTSFMSSGKKRRGFSETQILTCDYCNKKVTGKWSLQKHIERLHLKIRKYACDVCPEKYFDVTVLKKHKAKIHSIQCTKCGEEVNETEPWQEGIKQTDKRSVKCACGMNMMLQNEPPREPPTVETFIDEDGNVRKRKVKPTKRRRLEKIPMNCEYCGKTILGKWALRTHIQNMHLGAKGYECSICQMKFHSKASLKTHVIHVHTRQCKKCQTYVEESVPWPEGTERSMERIERCKCGANVVFCTNVGKRAHMGGVDEILIPDVIEEDQGRDETTDSPGYSVHIIRNRTQAEFQCNQCTKSFSHKKTLQNHVERIHSKVKHFGCSICPDTFFARKALELHVSSIHTKKCNKCERYLVETEVWGEGTHKCLRREMLCPCGETVAFQTARGLKQKINVDDDGGPTKVENGYACRHCGKLFQGKNRCIRHEMSHYTGEETVCSRCNADLRNTNDLKKHMETVHGYLFASCELCEKVFDSDPLLKLHVAKAHTGFIETGSHEQGTGTEEEYFGGEEELEEGEIKVENIQGLVQQSMAGDAELIQDMAADPEVEKVMSGLGPGQTMISQVEGGVIYVATRDSDLTTDGAREFVQQAIKDGHVTVPSGTISIILNKL